MVVYKEIAREIKEQIEQGYYAEGSYLPKETQLANLYRVSRATVHRALRILATNGYIASKKRGGTRVTYQRKTRKHLVALIFDRVARDVDFPSSEMIDGIRSRLGEGVGLVLCDSKDSVAREGNFLHRMSEETDGVICFPISDNRDGSLLEQYRLRGCPMVVIDRVPAGYCGTSVISNDNQATRESIRFLRENGHTKIGFIGFLKRSVSSAMARHKVFLTVSEELGDIDAHERVRWIGRDFEQEPTILAQSVQDAVMSLCQGEDACTAIYCMQDELIIKVLTAADALGLSVPDQVEIVGINEWPPLELGRPWDIHRIVRRKREIGERAAEELVAQIEGLFCPPKTICIPADFVPSTPKGLSDPRRTSNSDKILRP